MVSTTLLVPKMNQCHLLLITLQSASNLGYLPDICGIISCDLWLAPFFPKKSIQEVDAGRSPTFSSCYQPIYLLASLSNFLKLFTLTFSDSSSSIHLLIQVFYPVTFHSRRACQGWPMSYVWLHWVNTLSWIDRIVILQSIWHRGCHIFETLFPFLPQYHIPGFPLASLAMCFPVFSANILVLFSCFKCCFPQGLVFLSPSMQLLWVIFQMFSLHTQIYSLRLFFQKREKEK